MLNKELKSSIDRLWDKFWSGGIANPLTAIEQMSYLIFMKRLEDLDKVNAKRASAKGAAHVSVFDGTFEINGRTYEKKLCRWSEWKHLNADEMLDHVVNVVFPFIKQIHDGEESVYARYMKDAVFMIPKPSLLQEAVAIVDELNITAQNKDTQGDIYEYLLSELKTAGKNGQFRTPRHIIKMIVALVDPDIGDRICDPAMGTAGFLIWAFEHILFKYTSTTSIRYDDEGEPYNLVGDKIVDKKHWEKLSNDTFYGYDFDTTMVRIGLMNMILHGIRNPKVTYMDTLSKRFDERGKYTIVLANPPFKGNIDESDINDHLTLHTTKTELLFVEKMIQLLDIGGKCGVIVPNGVLFGNSNAHQKLRKMLLDTCQLKAVVSMPSGIFRPYAGVGTAVLVFTKGGSTERVWFYDMKSDGFTLDDKRDRIDGKGDIPDIIEKFKGRVEGVNSIVVDVAKIKANGYNLSYSQYREIVHEEITYEKPTTIIDRVLKTEDEITKELQELKAMLK